MGLFAKIKDSWYSVQDSYKQYLNDKKAKKRFPKIIKEVAEDRESVFNQYSVKYQNNYKQVIYVITIPEEYQIAGQSWQIMDKLNETSYFISRYLREVLGIGDNLSMPEYFHLEDPSNNDIPSCRYLAMWQYQPVLKSKKIPYIINSSIFVSSIGIIGLILGLILL